MSLLNMKVPESAGKTLTILPETSYDAVLHAIIELGRHPRPHRQGEKPKEPVHFVKFLFEIPGAREDGSSHIISMKKLNVSLNEKSTLSSVLRTLFKVKTVKEVEDILIKASDAGKNPYEALLGTPVHVTLTDFEVADGRTVQLVESFTLLDPRLPKPKSTEEHFTFFISSPNAASVFKNKLNPYTQDTIMSSLEAKDYPAQLQLAMAEVNAQRKEEQRKKGKSVEDDVLGG